MNRNGKQLTITEAKSIYSVAKKALVCDNCIDEMIENGELTGGDGVNEHLMP